MERLLHIQVRRIYQPDCTIGVLTTNTGLRLFTLELPWIDNKKNISCIPSGDYDAFTRKSDKNGWVIELKNVPFRKFIQIHSANYTSQIKGCIAVGSSLGDINNDGVIDVANSKSSMSKLLAECSKCEKIKVSIL